MTPNIPRTGRRKFLKATAGLASGITGLALLPAAAFSHPTPSPFADGVNIIGPKHGFSRQIGTLVSMMAWMRMVVLSAVKGMTTEQLDFLLDEPEG